MLLSTFVLKKKIGRDKANLAQELASRDKLVGVDLANLNFILNKISRVKTIILSFTRIRLIILSRRNEFVMFVASQVTMLPNANSKRGIFLLLRQI